MFHYDDLGPMVSTARKDLAISQRQLAVLAETPLSKIAKLEDGIPAAITVEQLLRVLHCVGLDLKVRCLPAPRPTYDDLVKETRTEH